MLDLIVTAFGGKIFGVERATGAQRWRVQLSEYTAAVVELFITDERVIALGAWLGIIERRTGSPATRLKATSSGGRRSGPRRSPSACRGILARPTTAAEGQNDA